MAVPNSVQRQVEEAEAHYESLNENPDDKTPAPEDGDTPKGTESNPQPATDPRQTDTQDEQEPQRSADYWEHRFNVINGKYAAEVPALRDQVKQLEKQVHDKDAEIQRLSQSQAPSGNGSDLTDEQVAQFKDEFGEDVVDFIERLIESRTKGSGDVDDLRKTVDELRREKQQSQEEKRLDDEALFWKALKELVPSWESINKDPKFHRYLAQFDPATGIQRQQMLEDAQKALDADAIADIFSGFSKNATRIPPEDVDPRSSRNTGDAPQGGHIWTGAEISQFYRDKTAGKYTEEEAKRQEADIFAAQRQGRVR